MTTEIELLRGAHALFTAPVTATVSPSALGDRALPGWPGDRALTAWNPPAGAGALMEAYRRVSSGRDALLRDAGEVDVRMTQILVDARRDHATAHRSTGDVLAAARADAATLPENPIAARELLRRKVVRLRTQRGHVRAARVGARRRRSALSSLRYRMQASAPNGGRAETAVRAALSRLGRPYVWGATGPDRFDCSGLVQWAYAQAGVRLRRTTYEQIHDGLPVGRSQVRPGDLVFPHTGHVQLAIGNGMVVEAPQPGAAVQISRMGSIVAIRRPV